MLSLYKTHVLYNRKFAFKFPISKYDWLAWMAACASISNDQEVRNIGAQIVHQLFVYVNTTPSRVPLSDFYVTESGKQLDLVIHFEARPVVGGLFALSLIKQRHI